MSSTNIDTVLDQAPLLRQNMTKSDLSRRRPVDSVNSFAPIRILEQRQQNHWLTFHCIGWLIGILTMVYSIIVSIQLGSITPYIQQSTRVLITSLVVHDGW